MKPPVFISYVKQKIKEFQSQGDKQPIEFQRVDDKVGLDLKYLVEILTKDVSHRFLTVSGKKMPLYKLHSKEIELPNPEVLLEYSDILFEVINYRWSQILESFNSSPRISKKVKITDRGGVKRKSLDKFHKYLRLLKDDHCFICGNTLSGDITIDHLIPWSYMFSDDLWNMVYTHRGCNSSKSNIIVNEEQVKRLENRNVDLLKEMDANGMRDKHFEELRFSIDKNLVRSFWIGFKG